MSLPARRSGGGGGGGGCEESGAASSHPDVQWAKRRVPAAVSVMVSAAGRAGSWGWAEARGRRAVGGRSRRCRVTRAGERVGVGGSGESRTRPTGGPARVRLSGCNLHFLADGHKLFEGRKEPCAHLWLRTGVASAGHVTGSHKHQIIERVLGERSRVGGPTENAWGGGAQPRLRVVVPSAVRALQEDQPE